MQGRITEQHLDYADTVVPGIVSTYDSSIDKPLTFLDLLWKHETQKHNNRPSSDLTESPVSKI